jgi:hypothetical protein
LEDHHGPIRAVVTFVLTAALAVWGLKRTATAAILLVALGGIPPTAAGLENRSGLDSLAAVSAAPVITGVLYLISAVTARRSTPTQREHPFVRPPKAA